MGNVADVANIANAANIINAANANTLEALPAPPQRTCVSLPVQLYPGGGSVVKLMETLSDWLLSLPLQRIPYQAVLDLVDNKMRVRLTN